MDTKKFKMGWMIVAFDLPVGEKSRGRLQEVSLGRRVSDDAVQRVCASDGDIFANAKAYEAPERAYTSKRGAEGDICNGKPMGEVLRSLW